jgi:uncharacterized membrane protein
MKFADVRSVIVPASIVLAASARAQSTFTPLGDLPGGSFHSEAWGVSADGTTVVGHSLSTGAGPCTTSGSEGFEAFVWKSATGIVGKCDIPGGPEGSFAYDASADGAHYVGYSYSVGGNEAHRDMLGYGDLAGGPLDSVASRVSDGGGIAVGRGWTATGVEAAAFTSGGVRGLGDLPGGSVYSVGRGISGNGVFGVGVSESALGTEAFRINLTIVAAPMEPLGDLAGGSFLSDAYGASFDGSVVVGESIGDGSSPSAFRWTASGGMVDIAAGSWSRAQACSADGNVIVGEYFSLGGAFAMIWDPLHGARMLEDVLRYHHGLDAALMGWHLAYATDVSADGHTICGYGTNPSGSFEGFVAHLADTPFESFCFGDGYGTACPCGNESPVPSAAGCLHSFGGAGKLTASGTASVAADSVVLTGTGMTAALAIYLQGTLGTFPGDVYGDGKLCTSGAVIRLGAKLNSGLGASSYPGPGDLPVSVKGLVPAVGGKRVYQTYYRNSAPFCTAATYNATSGVEIRWTH